MTQSSSLLPKAEADAALETVLPEVPFGPAFIDAYREHYLAWGRDCYAAGAKLREAGEPYVSGKSFTRAWINLEELPGGMMTGTGGPFGPVPASTSCWITTSALEAERLKGKGSVLEIFTRPAAPRVEASEPSGYAYRYQDAFGGGTVIRFNGGGEINGVRPIESVPYFFYAAPQASFADAYEGAREDTAIWKRRALEAENLLRIERDTSRRLVAEINAQNGPVRMGEPAPQASAEAVRKTIETLQYAYELAAKVSGSALLAGEVKGKAARDEQSALVYHDACITLGSIGVALDELKSTAAKDGGECCQYCDGTGDVHDATGEWRGSRDCQVSAKGAEDVAHEIWSAAQLAQGEGIADGVARIQDILDRQQRGGDVDERAAFEAAYRERFNVPDGVALSFPDVGPAWEWWQARAALTAQPDVNAQPSNDSPHYELAFICRVLSGDAPIKADLSTALGMARRVRVAMLKERAALAAQKAGNSHE
ncbi:MAG TPA: hypothetical protein VEA17_09745 [Bordetella sp.]|nr:hypothetical protein [Bordetella sp.]